MSTRSMDITDIGSPDDIVPAIGAGRWYPCR